MTVQQSPLVAALVVDDMVDNRDIFTLILQMAGYTITTAADGQEALELLITQHFHLMILDLDMPILNGRDVLLTLQNQPQHRPHIIKPIIVKEVVTLSKRLNPNNVVS